MKIENHYLPNEGFIRPKDLLKIIPVSRSTLYSWVKEKKFPQPVKLGGKKASAFNVNDVRDFIKQHQSQYEKVKSEVKNA